MHSRPVCAVTSSIGKRLCAMTSSKKRNTVRESSATSILIGDNDMENT